MRDSTFAGDTITVFDIIQYHYCPRKVYFLKVMGVPAPVRRKMAYGSEIHEKERRRMMERKLVYGFDREKVDEVMQNLQIEAEEIGLRGKLDVALRLKSGEIVPVDTKYTDEAVVRRQYRKQLHAYALLLDHHFETNVRRGIIYFSKQREPRIIDISHKDKEGILRDIVNIRHLRLSEEIPRAVSPDKCRYCEVKKYCVK